MRNISNCAICVAATLVWQIASGAAPAEAADLGGGLWRYEYAVFNLDSHRSMGQLEIPMAAGTTVSLRGDAVKVRGQCHHVNRGLPVRRT